MDVVTTSQVALGETEDSQTAATTNRQNLATCNNNKETTTQQVTLSHVALGWFHEYTALRSHAGWNSALPLVENKEALLHATAHTCAYTDAYTLQMTTAVLSLVPNRQPAGHTN